ncbi:glycosyltransferase family protein [Campylobacter devanensis]|uniref:glycosyltransferase family protein n=1 Tax=Campylobacter devanensis TaxID=3161138 RepID=UPI000A353223|nr:glycosyltransferase [Campylobacter sp. P0088]
MARVFLSFYNGIQDESNPHAMSCFYESFIHGLVKAGNDVFAHMHNYFLGDDRQLTLELKEQISEFNPDLVILFNNSLGGGSIYKLCQCPVVIYEADSPIYYQNKIDLKKDKDDLFFVYYQEESKEILKSEFGIADNKIILVPFFSEIIAKPMEMKHNIVFLGSKFHTNRIYQFVRDGVTIEEQEIFYALLKEIERNPFINIEELSKRYNITDKIQRHLDIPYYVAALSDKNRTNVLANISDLGLSIYGNSQWIKYETNDPYLTLRYNPKKLYSLKHNEDLYNSSKIGININVIQAVSGFSWRVCDILASNACLVSEYKSKLKSLFPKVDIPTFTNAYEARQIVKNLLANENKRLDIVSAANEAIEKGFRLRHTLKVIEEISGISLQNGGEGRVKFISQNATTRLSLKRKAILALYNYSKKYLSKRGLIEL